MDLNRFKQLLESTMGDVRPLISEQKVKPIEILSSEQVPQSLVDSSTQPSGTFNLGKDKKGDFITFVTDDKQTFILRNIKSGEFSGFGGQPGVVEADKNTFFFSIPNKVTKFGDKQEFPADTLIQNSGDKWIGFRFNSGHKLACVKTKTNDFACYKSAYINKPKSKPYDIEYFKKNPKGKMTLAQFGDISDINGTAITDSKMETSLIPGDNMGRGFQAGEYNYEYVPNYQTMRNPSGEPVLSFDDDRFTMFFA